MLLLLIQAEQIAQQVLSKAFDNMFSIGLLVVVVYLLWRDNREARDYNQKRDQRMEELVENNNLAIIGFKEAMHNLASALDDLRQEIRQN